MSDWDILGLSSNASMDELRSIYKKKVLRAHPDKGGDADEFQRIQAAYNNVKNLMGFRVPTKRPACDPPKSACPPSFKRARVSVDSIKSRGPSFRGISIKSNPARKPVIRLPEPSKQKASSSEASASNIARPAKAAPVKRSVPNPEIDKKVAQVFEGLNIDSVVDLPRVTLEELRLRMNRLERYERKQVLKAMAEKHVSAVGQLEAHVRERKDREAEQERTRTQEESQKAKQDKTVLEILKKINADPNKPLAQNQLENIRIRMAPLAREVRRMLIRSLALGHLQQLEAHMIKHKKRRHIETITMNK